MQQKEASCLTVVFSLFDSIYIAPDCVRVLSITDCSVTSDVENPAVVCI